MSSDSAVVFATAVSKCCTQDFLSVVKTQGSSAGFLFSFYSAIPEFFFKEYFFIARVDFGIAFSINVLPSSAFFRKAQSGAGRHVLFG